MSEPVEDRIERLERLVLDLDAARRIPGFVIETEWPGELTCKRCERCKTDQH